MDIALNNPNFDFLYLNDMIGPEHPAYEMLVAKYAKTPDGKKLERFRKENDLYQDGLQLASPNKLDNFLRAESIVFEGDPVDRIGKITAIRRARSQRVDEMLKMMTTEEREQYLKEAEEKRDEERAKQEARLSESDASRKKREAQKNAKRNSFEQLAYQRSMKRKANQEKGRKFLDEEFARRKDAVDPVTARRLALEKREREERELDETAEANDALAAQEQGQGEGGGDAGKGGSQKKETPKGGAKNDAREVREKELSTMNMPALKSIMDEEGIPTVIGMSNDARIDAILAKEFPPTK